LITSIEPARRLASRTGSEEADQSNAVNVNPAIAKRSRGIGLQERKAILIEFSPYLREKASAQDVVNHGCGFVWRRFENGFRILRPLRALLLGPSRG
jgi:hypothetical protein